MRIRLLLMSDQGLYYLPFCLYHTVQLEGFFNFPPIPVGNKTEWKGLKFLAPLCFHPFWEMGENTAMKIHVSFLRSFEWDCSGVNHSCVLCLAWTEWKGLKIYSPLWFHPFGWKHSGIAEGLQCACHKITGNVWVEPWVGLQWVKQSVPLGWVGNLKTKSSSCSVVYDLDTFLHGKNQSVQILGELHKFLGVQMFMVILAPWTWQSVLSSNCQIETDLGPILV